MSEKIPCTLIEDLLPLYLEGEIQEDTKRFIEIHLSECKHCQKIYESMSSSVFQEAEFEDEIMVTEYSAEKKYLLRAKRVFLTITAAAVFIFLTFTGSSYLLGKTQGEYNQRFKLAEEHKFFLNVDETMEFNGHSITLSKILLDSSLTSVILESDLDLDYFDSIILKDNQEQFYPRAFTLFERHYYRNAENIYTLDFGPAREEAQSLILELSKFHDDESFASVTFEVSLDNWDKISQAEGYLKRYSKLLQTTVSGIGISLESLQQGAAHTDLELKLDFTDTIYDNVNFGWYTAERLKDVNILDLRAEDGNFLEIITIEDITMEQLIPEDGITPLPRPNYTTYKIVTTPLAENSSSLQAQLHNLFAFKYICHDDLQLDFSDSSRVSLNKTLTSEDFKIKLKSAIKENGKIKLYYEIHDKNNQPLPEYLLDARIRISENIYDVPVQGRDVIKDGEHYLEFGDMDSDKYTLNLSRVGFELKSNTHVVKLK